VCFKRRGERAISGLRGHVVTYIAFQPVVIVIYLVSEQIVNISNIYLPYKSLNTSVSSSL